MALAPMVVYTSDGQAIQAWLDTDSVRWNEDGSASFTAMQYPEALNPLAPFARDED